MSTKFTDIQLKELLNAQSSLNEKYSGENWREKTLPSDWLVTILTETAEMYESAPRLGGPKPPEFTSGWKFWKKNLENDVQNMKIEIIDVLHFLMSSLLHNNGINDILKTHREFNIPDEEIIDFNEAIIFTQSLFNMSIIQKDYTNAICAGFDMMYLLGSAMELSPDQMYDGYFKKNKLNQKRVEGGYMEGTYQKIDADGNEDNRCLDFK